MAKKRESKSGSKRSKKGTDALERVPERITIAVLKNLINENPKRMAYVLQVHFRRMATLLVLIGEDSARLLVANLDEHERLVAMKHTAELHSVGLAGQTNVLRDFTEVALLVNSALFGSKEFSNSLL